jgi:hypothetical protein
MLAVNDAAVAAEPLPRESLSSQWEVALHPSPPNNSCASPLDLGGRDGAVALLVMPNYPVQ